MRRNVTTKTRRSALPPASVRAKELDYDTSAVTWCMRQLYLDSQLSASDAARAFGVTLEQLKAVFANNNVQVESPSIPVRSVGRCPKCGGLLIPNRL